MHKITNPNVLKECEAIRAKNGGVLTPIVVVKNASKKRSPLHKYFDWNDTEAAKKWRLHQARTLIRAVVIVLPETEIETHAYCNLTTGDEGDREYRSVVEVLSDKEMRKMLLESAFKELRSFQKKYAHLQELANIFSAINKLTEFGE